MTELYTIMMYRHRDFEGISYLLGVYDDEEMAMDAAFNEMNRRPDYAPRGVASNLNHRNKDDKVFLAL